ncbi:MAG: hypothetical protein KDC34_16185 [Saprospiraceae bacterium]|nr:hypothetical protein [Saprospiraceae bacterium]
MPTLKPISTLSVEEEKLSLVPDLLGFDLFREMGILLGGTGEESLVFLAPIIKRSDPELAVFDGQFAGPGPLQFTSARVILLEYNGDRHCICQFLMSPDVAPPFSSLAAYYFPNKTEPENATELIDLYCHSLQFFPSGNDPDAPPLEMLYSSLELSEDLRSYLHPYLPSSALFNNLVRRGLHCTIKFDSSQLSENNLVPFLADMLGQQPENLITPNRRDFQGLFFVEEATVHFALASGITTNWSAGPINLEDFSLGLDFPLVANTLYPGVTAAGTVSLQPSSEYAYVPNGQFSFRGMLDPYWRSFGLRLNLEKNQLQPDQFPFEKESGWLTLLDLIPIRSVEMGIYGSLTDKVARALDWKIQGETFHLLDDRIRVTPSLELVVKYPFNSSEREMEASLEGIAEIGSDLKLRCRVSYPFPELYLELMEPVRSSSIIELFFEDVALPGPLHFELQELSMSYAIESKDFSFRTKVGSEHWTYNIGDFQIALSDLELYVENSAESTEYGLTANAKLQTTDLYLSGNYRKGSGWNLRTFTSGNIVLSDWLTALSSGRLELPESLQGLTISFLSFQYETGTGNLEASAGLKNLDPLKLGDSGIFLYPLKLGDSGIFLDLEEIRFSLEKREQTKAEFYGKTRITFTQEKKDDIKLGFALNLKYQSGRSLSSKNVQADETKTSGESKSNWSLEGRLEGDDPDNLSTIPIDRVISWIFTKTNLQTEAPAGLADANLEDVFIKADTAYGSFEIGGSCNFELDDKLKGKIDLSFRIQDKLEDGEKTGKEIQTHGILTINDSNNEAHVFALYFDKDPKSKYLFAGYQGHLTLQKVIGIFDQSAIDLVPAWISPSLEETFFLLYKNSEQNKKSSAWQMFMGLLMDIPGSGENQDQKFNLSQVDFIGKYIPEDKGEVQLTLDFSFSNAAISKELAEELNNKLVSFGSSYTIKVGGKDRAKGISVSPKIVAPILGLLPAGKKDTIPEKDAADLNNEPKTNWKPVRKQLGPVFIDKVGITMEHGRVKLLLDAGMEIGGFNFKMLDFTISVPMKPNINALADIEFGLNGLELNFTKGELTIAGGFYKQELHLDNPKIKGTFTGYVGEIRVKFGSKSLSAMGGYVSLHGTPSFFLYAVAEIPLGGPPEFFVEGVAGGFGINSAVKIPAVEEIRNFIMVKSAFGEPYFEGDNQSSNLSRAFTDFEPTPGSYWIAIGIKASTYKFLESFLLAIVSFGDRLEIDVLGIARVKLPGAAQKMAKAELQLHARLVPEEGVLMVDGKISEGSYLFNPMAKLSGGYAFYSWFTDQYETDAEGNEKISVYAGDFVMTLGGYSPYYNKPAHYPSVDRLALTYKVNDDLFVKASAYFALTPRHFMIGGKLEGVFHTDFVRANLTVEAHFLVNFEPFAYQLEAGISLSGEVWALWWHSFHVGLHISLWGPEFGGVALIDLGFFDFEIEFGKPKQLPLPIGWVKFRDTLLPPESEINKVFVSEGIIQENKYEQFSAEQVRYLVNPIDLELQFETAMPACSLQLNDQEIKTVSEWTLGIAPMALSAENYKPVFHVTVESVEIASDSRKFIDLEVEPIHNAVPAGLWGKFHDQDINGKALLGTTDESAPLTGLKVRPTVSLPAFTVSESLKNLLQPEVTGFLLNLSAPDSVDIRQLVTSKKDAPFSDYFKPVNSSAQLEVFYRIPGLEHLAELTNIWSPGAETESQELETILNQYENAPLLGSLGVRTDMAEPHELY